MFRLPLLLLLVSLALADDRFIRRKIFKPNSTLTNNFVQNRGEQLPNVEIKESNVGRYFRRRPQTTTVPSIFSMKVENESQHVYPNMNPSENLNVQPKQEEMSVTESTTPKQEQNIPRRRTNWKSARPNNEQQRTQNSRRRRPSYVQTPAPIIQQTEETTETVVTTTTSAPILETTVKELKEQEKVVLVTFNVSNEVPSLDHPTISQIPEEIIQKMTETPEKGIISTTNTPLDVLTTEKVQGKHEFTPSKAYVSNLISFMKKRRPVIVLKTALPLIQEKEAANKQTIDSTTTAPMAASSPANEHEKTTLSPPASNVSDLVSVIRPKSHRPFNRGTRRFHLSDVKKDKSIVKSDDLEANTPQVTSTTLRTPPPVPTLSPWYDGFGK